MGALTYLKKNIATAIKISLYIIIGITLSKIDYNKSFFVSSADAAAIAKLYHKNINENGFAQSHQKNYYHILNFLGATREPINIINKNQNNKNNTLIKLSFDDALNNTIKFFLLLIIDITRVFTIIISTIIVTLISLFDFNINTILGSLGFAAINILLLLLHPFLAVLYIIGLTNQPSNIWYTLTWITLSSTTLLTFYLSLWATIFGISSSTELVKRIILSAKESILFFKKLLF